MSATSCAAASTNRPAPECDHSSDRPVRCGDAIINVCPSTRTGRLPDMHVTAIIAAGGAGLRLGAGVAKQLLEVGETSILQRSVWAFGNHPEVDEVIVSLPSELAAAPPIEP